MKMYMEEITNGLEDLMNMVMTLEPKGDSDKNAVWYAKYDILMLQKTMIDFEKYIKETSITKDKEKIKKVLDFFDEDIVEK